MDKYFYPLHDNVYAVYSVGNFTNLIGIWIFQSNNLPDNIDNTPVEVAPLNKDYNPFLPIIPQAKFSYIEYIADIFP